MGRNLTNRFPHFFVFLFMFGKTHESWISVLYNSTSSHQCQRNEVFRAAVKTYFKEITSNLDIAIEDFEYKDFNSTFCDLGAFLAFVRQIRASKVVVSLLQDCECERKLLFLLDLRRIKFVSSCERPLFTVKETSSILKQTNEYKQLYLLVSADRYGATFYEDFTLELQQQKIALRRSLWIGVESSNESQFEKELKIVSRNIERNFTSGATFVLGFLNPSDVRLMRLVVSAQKILGKQFGKVLWIFPVIHLNFKKFPTFQNGFQALIFQESAGLRIIRGSTNYGEFCGSHIMSEKMSAVLKNCWGKYLHQENITEHNANTTAYCVAHKISRKTPNCKTSPQNCFIDVLQLRTDQYFGDVTSTRIGTWNGDTVQPCLSPREMPDSSNFLTPNAPTVFRVPIVEYFPFVVKHKLSDFHRTKCPINSLPCYGQRMEKTKNSTVIDYNDWYCCTGWTIDVLLFLLSRERTFQFELYFQEEKFYGIYDSDTAQWNGVVQDIITGKGDLAVDLVIRSDRCTVLDCSLGYLFDGLNVIVRLEFPKKDGPEKASFAELVGNFQIFLNPFHVDLLVIVLMLFNLFLFLIWAADKICLSYRNKRRGRKKEKFTLLESTSYVWATAFGRDVGDSKKPLTLSARYLSSWLAFLSLIFVNVYVARLMAEIVKQELSPPFTSLQDPQISDKKLKLGVVKGSSMEAYFHNNRDPVLQQNYDNNIKHNTLSLDQGVEAVKNGTLDGFIADTVSLSTILNQDPNCSLSLMGRDIAISPVGFLFRKGWHWADEFVLQQLAMNENKKNEDYWKGKQSRPLCQPAAPAHPRLGIVDMSGLFLILIFAIAYCFCFSLVMENIQSLLARRRRQSSKSA